MELRLVLDFDVLLLSVGKLKVSQARGRVVNLELVVGVARSCSGLEFDARLGRRAKSLRALGGGGLVHDQRGRVCFLEGRHREVTKETARAGNAAFAAES